MSFQHTFEQTDFQVAASEAELRQEINSLQAELQLRSIILEALDLNETPDAVLLEKFASLQSAREHLWYAERELEDLQHNTALEPASGNPTSAYVS